MDFSIYRLLGLFLVYSFLGWVLETAAAAVRHKKFLNKGLVNGPFCTIYGFTVCIVTVFFQELTGIWLFAASAIMSVVAEWTAGHAIEKMFHERWWDYSDRKWNLDGYICLSAALLWGALCMIAVTWGNDLIFSLLEVIPPLIVKVVELLLVGVLLADILATLIILSGRSRKMEKWESVDQWLSEISSRMGRVIYGYVDRRIGKAYPNAKRQKRAAKRTDIFAYGCGFYKIFWLFMIGAFLGDLVETIFCRITGGVWMSRSSVVWGPFSIVWGLAIAAATLLLYRYKDRSDSFLFAAGTFLGGAYEYICSVFTELLFGKVFWDYSEMPFNLGGRINLLYCFFWGLAAVVWIKILYPRISRRIEKLPVNAGKILTWMLLVFMCCNIMVSCMALFRAAERGNGVKAEYRWQEIMDERFDDERMHRIYPNAIEVP